MTAFRTTLDPFFLVAADTLFPADVLPVTVPGGYHMRTHVPTGEYVERFK